MSAYIRQAIEDARDEGRFIDTPRFEEAVDTIVQCAVVARAIAACPQSVSWERDHGERPENPLFICRMARDERQLVAEGLGVIHTARCYLLPKHDAQALCSAELMRAEAFFSDLFESDKRPRRIRETIERNLAAFARCIERGRALEQALEQGACIAAFIDNPAARSAPATRRERARL